MEKEDRITEKVRIEQYVFLYEEYDAIDEYEDGGSEDDKD